MEVKCAFICYFLVLASTLWLPGEAQLCPTTTPCDVSFDVSSSFQQYNLDDNIKTCIRCLFNGMVFSDTTWNIEDPPISLTDEPDPLGTSNNGVLEICSTNPILDRTDDNGPRFICASATAGDNHTLFMTIRALNPPSITPVDEPLIIEGGTAQTLSCLHPDSQPVTLEQWTGPDGSVLSNQSTLILTNPSCDDTGLYNCTITDDRSETRNSSRTIVVRSECYIAPINPLLICGSSNLTFTWDPPSAELTTAVADGWCIEIEEDGGDDILMNGTISAQPTMFVFTDPTPLTVYCARVAGLFIDATNMNMQEIGEFSNYNCCLSAPTLTVTVIGLSAFALNITWQPPEDNNGGSQITEYVVSIKEIAATQFEPLGTFGSDVRYYFLWGKNNMFTLTGDTTYDVRVVAELSDGAETIIGTGQGTTLSTDPPQPIYVAPNVSAITNESAVISWIHPCGTVDRFILQYTPENGDFVTLNTTDGNATSFEIGVLSPNTTYSVRVASNNDIGTSSFSPPAFFTTDVAMPTAEIPTTIVLSTGAIIGIAVGGGILLVITVVLLVVCCLLVIRHNTKKKTSLKPDSQALHMQRRKV